MTWQRLAPGEYQGRGELWAWSISRIDYGYGPEWTAYCADGTEQGTTCDPLPTLARAKAAAEATQAAWALEQEARDLAANDCQMWDNLPAGAQQRYRELAKEEAA